MNNNDNSIKECINLAQNDYNSLSNLGEQNSIASLNNKVPKDTNEVEKDLESNSFEDDRDNWSHQCDFFLSCLGFAIGVGNVWRFPHLAYKNGGGAFLVPYFLFTLLAGLPVFFMELAVGQYVSLGPCKLFENLSPLFGGIGYGMVIISFMVSIYFNILISWSIFYMFASFTSTPGWTTCGNWFNTENCFTQSEELACIESTNNSAIFWNNTCTTIVDYCLQHGYQYNNQTHCINVGNSSMVDAKPYINVGSRMSSSEDYYRNYMLGVGESSWSNFGSLKWDSTLSFLLAWVIVAASLIKGIKSSGKVVYFTALFPYVALFVLMIRAATLDGAMDGIRFFITPNVTKLQEMSVWSDAASQVFYSLGPAFGTLITLSSYNKFHTNCMRDAISVVVVNMCTSLYAGLVIFSITGFMAKQLSKNVGEVVASGTGLAFIAYPEAVGHMPVTPLWAFLFFAMMITLGLDSQFSMVETVTTTIFDQWPYYREHKSKVVIGTSVIFFLLGLPLCARGGIFMFTLLDSYSASWNLIFIAFLETVLIAWVYGSDNLMHNLQKEMNITIPKVVRGYWILTWKYVTPSILLVIAIISWIRYEPISYENYPFPLWINVIGWILSILPISVIVIVAIRVYIKNRDHLTLSDMLKPTDQWCPASQRGNSSKAKEVVEINEKYVVKRFD